MTCIYPTVIQLPIATSNMYNGLWAVGIMTCQLPVDHATRPSNQHDWVKSGQP